MAKREQHNEEGRAACEAEFGRPLTAEELDCIDQVNVLIDQFAHYPNPRFLSRHRAFLHHEEGIEYFAMRFGRLGEIVARRHVITDCGHVPRREDYSTGRVDEYGYLR